jgi:hypothetical protein
MEAGKLCCFILGVSIIDPTRPESYPTRHDLKINGLSMDLLFLIRIRLDRVQDNLTPEPIRLIMFFEVIYDLVLIKP